MTSAVGATPAAISPVLRKLVTVPEASLKPMASDLDPVMVALIWPEFSNEGRDAPASILMPVTACSPVDTPEPRIVPALTRLGVEAPAAIRMVVLLALLAEAPIVPLL
ncbi:hypothetical protein D3C80_1695460 [compost metagenome]